MTPLHPAHPAPDSSASSSPTHAPPVAPDAGRSKRIPVPSDKRAEAEGVLKNPRVRQAVEESAAAGARVKEARQARRSARVAARSPAVEADIAALAELFGDVSSWSDADIALAATLQLDSEYQDDPVSLREALDGPFGSHWTGAIKEELKSIKDLEVYELIPRSEVPAGRKIMDGKFVFRLKRDENGDPTRFKARWVCRGFQAVPGIDFNKTTSPTMRMESLRAILHIAAARDWDIFQVDVKTAFLYGLRPDGEECYMEQPPGFVEPGFEDHVWQLNRSLYGLPDGGRCWYKTMDKELLAIGFARAPTEACIYMRTTEKGTVLTGVHVDDHLGASSTTAARLEFIADLCRLWKLSDVDAARFVVGIHILRHPETRTVSLSQTALIDRIVEKFNLVDAAPISSPMDPGLKLSRDQCPSTPEERAAMVNVPYRALVGSLNYVAVGTRPDISYAVQQLAQFLDSYGPVHWEAAKRVVRYLRGTRTLSLRLGGPRVAHLVGFSDSDWARCVDTRRSVGGYCFSLGSGVISWCARKQPTVSDSSTEAEYIAAAEAAKEAVWLRSLLEFVDLRQPKASPLLLDNSGAIVLSGDPSFHARSKHIEIKHHILREYTAAGKLDVRYVNTKDNIADIFTKPLPTPAFELLRGYLGLAYPPCEEESL